MKPTRQQIEDRLRELVADFAPTDAAILLATRFDEELNFDSLDVVELSMQIEEEYHVALEDDFEEYRSQVPTFGHLVDSVCKKLEVE